MPSLMENVRASWRWRRCSTAFPCLASNRGACRRRSATPASCVFDIPARYTPETRDVPTAEEVEPWVETIIRLWDDAAEYERWSRAARERAQQWHPDRLAPVYREFFGSITHQPGPAAGAAGVRCNVTFIPSSAVPKSPSEIGSGTLAINLADTPRPANQPRTDSCVPVDTQNPQSVP